MKIDRLEVSGGFLDGLGLSFADGLNVVIGARGAGKTSVLELIRFALGAPAMTPEAAAAAQRQARAVLGDGTVTLFCSHQDEQITLTRTALDEVPSHSLAQGSAGPLIVSQNEIEQIGLDPTSRRSILDGLIDPLEWADSADSDERSLIASLERRLDRLRTERDEYLDRAAKLEGVADLLATAEQEQVATDDAADQAKPLQKVIADQADEVGHVRASADAYGITEEAISGWKEELEQSKLDRPIPTLSSAAVEAQVAEALSNVRKFLVAAVDELGRAQGVVASARVELRTKQGELQAKLKADTEKLEELQKGAGEVGRRVSALRQQLKELEGYQERINRLGAEIQDVVSDRDRALDAAEAQADRRYELRAARAAELSSLFQGRIEVRVEKSGEFQAYQAALTDALQGSNLRYKSLASLVAEKMSPRELVAAVEAADTNRIVQATDVSPDRAVRLVAHLRDTSAADLLLAPLDDAVDFALLDGKDFKVTKDLSMGQRCTVVLPLLLVEPHESILLDQPEDHLDNAFIVDTLVAAIRNQATTGQVIVATHNANIPVLGDASQVVVLGSDGRRGFVKSVAPLDDDETVGSISTLMEGGREAFAKRAAFYREHQS